MAIQRKATLMNDAGLRQIYIETLGQLRNFGKTNIATGTSRSTAHRARQQLPDFAAACNVAMRTRFKTRLPYIKTWDLARRRRFIDAMALSGSAMQAARTASASVAGAYSLRLRDADFAAAWAEAREQALDIVEGEAIHRAIHGVDRTVFVKGVPHVVKVHSLAAMLRLLERRAARTGEVRRGRIIEVTPELIERSRRALVAQLVEHGEAALAAPSMLQVEAIAG